MRTKSVNKSEINHDWWVADAEGQTLGRFASQIAQVLRGKHKPQFTPHMDMGDYVIVVNAEKIRVSGNKEIDKMYFKHSGYPGGGSTKNLKFMRKTYPERVIENAIRGMLPHNRLGSKLFKHLKVFAGQDHLHHAQQPKKLEM
ncbi:MAG TPA: 50S ribosomal protein L13 [Candidatus Marinimicrobia bacterium]|jgi:large subunit ribosomal protein L13|nr:50S ribosomal protein L13 [Candidatus Neomarinimicrobiota bacterium]MDP6142857.1 50S ribosomal protein L13 [Candidatus Neomarinimicrobiota bacterium]MDP6261171.1 50S ribosomal protein L13 [Candidatus Neomarinimicrobiota bacterium]MDP7127245.1 50S ribosomal protein L13 [Candidatus Neomarinimicrobiota bacterium]MDP7337301.1 50S ribosomal protein L13 [Candidatus Neomarinimicrobiota bacterium]|tara:strand:- start:4325 stop:4753 length:429 start_codon:yes stop_codon:yes gene_type:complete